MKCPKCGSDLLTIVDSRHKPDYVFRRRKCEKCDFRFNTNETIVNEHLSRLPLTKEQRDLNRVKRILRKILAVIEGDENNG